MELNFNDEHDGAVAWVYNVKTSYSTQLKYVPNDNVLMSVGHLDHVLTVYSSMEHVTWNSPGPMCGWVGRILHPDLCISVSSWSKMPLLSTWSVAVPLCRPLLHCPSRWHDYLPRLGWLVSYTALPCPGGSGLCTSCERVHFFLVLLDPQTKLPVTDQMDKRGTLDQEDTKVHESGCRILPTQPHMGPDDFQVTRSIWL